MLEAVDTRRVADEQRVRILLGKPARQLKSAWTEAWSDPGNPAPLAMPLQSQLTQNAFARVEHFAHKSPGAAALVTYFVGQIVGTMNQSRPASQVVYDMIEEFIDAVESLNLQMED